jgi:hypothetical protein
MGTALARIGIGSPRRIAHGLLDAFSKMENAAAIRIP